MRFIYLINKEDTEEYKIGVSVDPIKRLKTLQTGNSKKLFLINSFKSFFATKIESFLRRKYWTTKQEGEWHLLKKENVESFLTDCEELEKTFIYLDKENIFFKKEVKNLKY